MLEDVHCTQSTAAIRCTDIETSAGENSTFVIQEGDAEVDGKGMIRAFDKTWSNGNHVHYKLLPKHAHATHVASMIAGYLTGLGLSRYGQKIYKGSEPIDHVVRYSVFGYGPNNIVKSFVEHQLNSHDLGYFDVATEELIFTHPLHAPHGTW